MNKIRNMLVAVIAITSLTFSAQSFEGFSIGTVYSQADFSTKGTENSSAVGVNVTNTVTKSGSADFGSVFAEYTFAQGSTLGLEYIPGDAEIGKASRTQSAPLLGGAGEDGSGLLTARAEVSDHYTFYAEPTYMMSDKFGVYVKGGASRVTITPSYTEAADIIQSTYNSQDVWGVMSGYGAKMYMGNLFAKIEYVETEYGEYAFTSTTGDLNTIHANIDVEATRVAIGYNF
jgi:hypothetical protein